ncbi:MAG: HPP family protein, partial [Armatimonadota bacterium]|nr:HPP family protein [Armatimonadota bacterium]
MKHKRTIGKALGVVCCLLGLFALLGFRCPVVGRDALWQDLPRSLLWWSMGLAVFVTTGLVALTRTPGERATSLILKWFLFYVLGLVWSIAFLLAVNGVFDRSTHHRYQARVHSHHAARSRRTTQYYLVVADWKNPAGRVTLQVNEAVYTSIDES